LLERRHCRDEQSVCGDENRERHFQCKYHFAAAGTVTIGDHLPGCRCGTLSNFIQPCPTSSNFIQLRLMLTIDSAFYQLRNTLQSRYEESETSAIAHIVMEAVTGMSRLQRLSGKERPLESDQTARFLKIEA